MARLFTAGFETGSGRVNAVTGTELAPAGVAAAVVQSGTVRSGAWAGQGSSGVGNSTSFFQMQAATATNGNGFAYAAGTFYTRFYFQVNSLPTTDTNIYVHDTVAFKVVLTTGGKIQLWNVSTNTKIGSDSAATVTTGTWYRFEIKQIMTSATAISDLELRLDGTSVATGSGLGLTSSSTVNIGWVSAPGASKSIFIDDICVNDATGASQNTWPGDGKIILLSPISDNARGTGWVNDANAASGFFDATNNVPPVGIAQTVASTGLHQIQNATANANSNVDLDLTDYTTAGVNGPITLVVPIAATAAPVATSAKAGTLGVVSNPAIANVALGPAGTSGAFWAAVTGGTYDSGWKWSFGTVTYAPTVTLGTRPVIRITQVTSSTRIAVVCFLGMYVEYTPPGPPVDAVAEIILQAVNRRTVW